MRFFVSEAFEEDELFFVAVGTPVIKTEICLPHYLIAPIKSGECVGKIIFTVNGETKVLPIYAAEDANNDQKRGFSLFE